MKGGGTQSYLMSGGGGGGGGGGGEISDESDTLSSGGGAAETGLVRNRRPRTAALSATPGIISQLNAAVAPFKPRSYGAQASVSCDTEQRTSQGSASGNLSTLQPGDPGLKSLRPSLRYVAEFKRIEEAKPQKEGGQSSSQTETPSTIGEAFLAAPPAKSFLKFIDQTKDIVLANSLTAQGAQVKELSGIGSGTLFKPNPEVFNATGAFKRTRSPAFPQLTQGQPPSTSAPDSAAILGQILVGPVSSQSAISHTVERPVPPSRYETISTPATVPAGIQTSYITPPRGSLAYRNLQSITGPRRPSHMHSQSFSQPAPRLFSASRPAPISFSDSRPTPSSSSASQPASNLASASDLPPQRQFITPTKSSLGASQPLTQASPLDRPNDTEEQKKIIKSVMSSFREVGDPYDSIEWLPNEGQANYGESPEPLTVPAQPVNSYTTVGSLRPATNQHFTAPNRIQRDGTGRRAPQANPQGRGHDNHFGGRNSSQQYNTGYGPSTNPQYGAMNYSQPGSVNQPQFGSTQTHFGSMNQSQHDSTSQPKFGSPALPQHGNMSQPQYGVPNQSQYGALAHSLCDSIPQRQYGPSTQYGSENQTHHGSSTQSRFGSIHSLQNLNGTASIALTAAEKNVLQANGLSEPLIGNSRPSMRSGNLPQQHHDMVQKFDPSLNPQAESFNLEGQLKDNGSGQIMSAQNTQPKAEKMENFSQDKNPIQQLTKGHPVEATIPHTQHNAASAGAHIAQQSAMTGATSYGQTVNSDNNQGNTGYENQDKGGFDHNYRFPPPGLAHPTQANRSGSGYGQQPASGFGSYEQVTTNQQHQIPSGRPQPLTAGPPGQRQNANYVTAGMSSAQGIQVGSSLLSNVQNPPVLPTNSPWIPNYRNNMFTSVPTEHSRIRDTLSLEEVRQYYPNGFPKDMTGQYTRLPGAIHESRPGMTEEEVKNENTNKWFHARVRELNKTANDHLTGMENRNYNLDRGLRPQPPGTRDDYGNPLTLRELASTSEALTIREVIEMPLPEVAGHLLGPVFGTTLNLADQRPGPNNVSMLSRFTPAPAWAIDNSVQGNQSFFGEDWGQAPRRAGRDPRYQHSD